MAGYFFGVYYFYKLFFLFIFIFTWQTPLQSLQSKLPKLFQFKDMLLFWYEIFLDDLLTAQAHTNDRFYLLWTCRDFILSYCNFKYKLIFFILRHAETPYIYINQKSPAYFYQNSRNVSKFNINLSRIYR